jgi:phosphate ABC transporter permease protein PstC
MASTTVTPDPANRLPTTLATAKTGSWLDPWVKRGLVGLSALIFFLLLGFLAILIVNSHQLSSGYGLGKFVTVDDWVVNKSHFGALGLMVGTLITAAVALVLGVPVAVAVALYVTELAPRRISGVIAAAVDLLAAVPSVVYGLWGLLFLVPKLKPAEDWFVRTFHFIPFVGGPVSATNYFIVGLILAIMIVPIVSAVAREVMTTVPADHKEAALALGATRWEMIRVAVLPYSRSGIVGGAMLGLGRALGETIAVAMIIGNTSIGHSLFSSGGTLAGTIALNWQESTATPAFKAALIACGLLLFIVTLVINAIARGYINRAETRLDRAERKARAVDAKQAAAAGGPNA